MDVITGNTTNKQNRESGFLRRRPDVRAKFRLVPWSWCWRRDAGSEGCLEVGLPGTCSGMASRSGGRKSVERLVAVTAALDGILLQPERTVDLPDADPVGSAPPPHVAPRRREDTRGDHAESDASPTRQWLIPGEPGNACSHDPRGRGVPIRISPIETAA